MRASYFKKGFGKLKGILAKLAREGMSRNKMSACIALGVYLSIFPVFGVTTLLCAVAAFAFRLNMPLIQLVNYAVYPLQIFLLVPFYGAGSWLFGSQLPFEIDDQLIASLKHDLWGSLLQIWDLTLYAISAWLLVGPLVVLILYASLKPVVGKILAAVHKTQSARSLSKNPT